MEAGTIIATIALIVSILAVGISWRSSVIAHRALDIERDRRHEELKPDIRAEYLPGTGRDEGRVRITNHGPGDYILKRIAVPEQRGPLNPVLLGFVVHDELKLEWEEQSRHPYPFSVGSHRTFTVSRSGRRGDLVVLRVNLTSLNGKDEWPVPVPCEVPEVPEVL